MQVYNHSNEGVSIPNPIHRIGLRLAIAMFALVALTLTQARAEDKDDYKGWPKQSRAERLGTFTYVYGGAGFVSHTGTEEGKMAYALNDEPALEDPDDIFMTGGFGVRFANDLNFEVGLALLNGAYDAPSGTGTSPKPDQPAFEMSLMKGFDLGGPPLWRYTLRAGFASIDDPKADDSGFFGIGIAHEPFRAEFRCYDFGTFQSDVFAVSYIYDF
tara:strand:- start:1735 stop:2379 length:645 start_codon:yes stop_codon:yes gene_type:complete